ncbi:DUF4350 domain-containing protein [Pseudarthrobacter sp. J75]|uniref:DUF4350 domain-containing protein n=1 Tax=unclassified Pseudarthrobacter TaxID=2647000 RepID=UPI002E80F75B|nr:MULTISPECIES: DUF4350 domain-containing protein [unclassified Pseudarthrobacter]MEE2521366.1 DUF4350 domain-containing protein [Pseudarthrobacter sp. J47]MEE2528598.1 DUF4350 domain-containing protein [Pseudarthrobacter sp. J75]
MTQETLVQDDSAAPRSSGGNRALDWARKHRGLVLALLVLVLALVIIVANALAAPPDGRVLSARNPGPSGAQAVARILGNHGVAVHPVDDFSAAVEVLSRHPDSTLFLYDAGSYLDSGQLQRLKGLAGRVVVVAPRFATLQDLDAGIHQAGVVPEGTEILESGCPDDDAVAAGPILAPDAFLYSGGSTCYGTGAADGPETGVMARSSTGDITVLGSSRFLSNADLAQQGNAALAIRSLGISGSLVWYLPGISDFNSPGSERTLNELAPPWANLLGPWLIFVAALAMVWRGRRLGPLVFEPLPVVVQAGETVYGRARLYHNAGATDLARNNLRAGTLARLANHFRMPADASADDVARRTAEYLDRPYAEVLALLDKTPTGEARLVQWAQDLNKLEQEVAER